MDAEAAARRWAETLRRAWPAGDIDAFVALYADDAWFKGPFSALESAREHMRRALSLGEPGADVWTGDPLVVGDRAAIEWWAVVVVDGAATTFAATAWLRFGPDGRVVDEQDYWNSASDRHEPWDGWGARPL